VTHQVQVYSDHQKLKYFTTTKVLNRRQAIWAQEFAGIDFRIYYRPGTKNGKPDALSTRLEYHPEKGGSENQLITMLLQKNHFAGSVSQHELTFVYSLARLGSLAARKWSKEFEEQVKDAGKKDKEYKRTWKDMEKVRMESASDG